MKRLHSYIVIATQNRHKVREIKRILGRLPLPVKGLLELFPPRVVRETGKTLQVNAVLKARAAFRRTGLVSVADDSGLEVKALRGAPGVKSARFAGPGCGYADNNRRLLRLLKGVPPSKRSAVFRCVVAVAISHERMKFFEGSCAGTIVPCPRGRRGFGYDPVFQPRGHRRTFAELALKEKNRISHRYRAFDKAKLFLQDFLGRR